MIKILLCIYSLIVIWLLILPLLLIVRLLLPLLTHINSTSDILIIWLPCLLQ